MSYLLMQTDFGEASAAMIGVAKIVDKDLRVFQITNVIPKFSVRKAAESLIEVIPYWPAGTVFVSVVDPGVGTARKACVAILGNGSYVVTPDNGILDLLGKQFGLTEVREIDQSINRYHGNYWSDQSNIFHGRDIFAYCGARLASGVISFSEVGPEYSLKEIIPYSE